MARQRPRTPKPPPVLHAEQRHAVEPTLAAVVRERTGGAWSRARALCTDGRVSVDGQRCVDPARRVAPGAAVVVDELAPRVRGGPLAEHAIVHVDRDLVVVDKPAGMLSIPDHLGTRGTLADLVRTLLRSLGHAPDAPLDVVHRLDRETSGLIVFARSPGAKRALAEQFRAHDIDRVYRAIAHGDVRRREVETLLVRDRGDGLRGSFGHFRRPSGEAPPEARRAVTHVAPLAALAGATYVECRLMTGRQHQIRIHLAELGHPLVGERVYIRDYHGPRIASARTMLHAHTLGFVHPRSRAHVLFQREPPEDFAAMLRTLRMPDPG